MSVGSSCAVGKDRVMGQKFMTDKPTIQEILRLKNKHTASVDILYDAELLATIKELERKHLVESRNDDRLNRTPLAPDIRKEIDGLTDEVAAKTVTFTFQDIGRKRFEDLWKTCPPTDEQKEKGYDWNPDDFAPIILSASCVKAGDSDSLTLDEATTIYNEWSTAEAEMLVMTAINANMGAASIPLSGTATADQLSSELNLTTAPKEESPTPTT